MLRQNGRIYAGLAATALIALALPPAQAQAQAQRTQAQQYVPGQVIPSQQAPTGQPMVPKPLEAGDPVMVDFTGGGLWRKATIVALEGNRVRVRIEGEVATNPKAFARAAVRPTLMVAAPRPTQGQPQQQASRPPQTAPAPQPPGPTPTNPTPTNPVTAQTTTAPATIAAAGTAGPVPPEPSQAPPPPTVAAAPGANPPQTALLVPARPQQAAPTADGRPSWMIPVPENEIVDPGPPPMPDVLIPSLYDCGNNVVLMVMDGSTYVMNNELGQYLYDRASLTVQFKTGPLKGLNGTFSQDIMKLNYRISVKTANRTVACAG